MDVMHIDEIKSLAHRAHDDSTLREELFRDVLRGEGREAYHAAWALTHLPKEDDIYIDTRREELTAFAIATPDTSLRRLALVLLERLEWGRDDVRTDLLDFCLEHMMLADETYGVKSLCMKISYQMCRHYPELKEELRQSLLLMEPSELGTGVKHTRGKILEKLRIEN